MRTLTRVEVENFLSLKSLKVDLKDLLVLVGPNGSGKTNLLSVFRFIGDIARTDLAPAIDAFGGIRNLRFRGRSEGALKPISIALQGVMTEHANDRALDRYELTFSERPIRSPGKEQHASRLISRREVLVIKRKAGRGRRITLSGGEVKLVTEDKKGGTSRQLELKVQEESSGLAILRRLGKAYEAAQVEQIASIFEDLRLFDVNVQAARAPSTTEDQERLRADGSNVAAFLNWLRHSHPESYNGVRDDIAFVLPGFQDFEFTSIGGPQAGIRLDIKEAHLAGSTPLARASFGTIRAIALFSMLHDPNPPKLTCMEEVDHGLHPHALDRLVERMREASERTQMIIATHSPALVNRMNPEELLVLERDPKTGATVKPDFTADELEEMTEKSGLQLGELWFSGLLGGGLSGS